jgi:hypothetical protein
METKHLATRVSAIIILLGFVLFIGGCKKPSASNPYPYTPDDFSNPLRDLLKKIEQHNIVYLSNSGCRGDGSIYDSAEVYYGQLSYLAATKELLKASRCSNPSIRATALSILLYDTTVNAANLVREHMFDTAQVFDDYDEKKWTIISFMLHNSYRWPDKASWQAVRKQLLQQNPFEVAAYYLLDAETPVDTFPGYYQTVKKMARNVGFYFDKNNWFNGIGALNKLASYRYPEDIPLLDSLIESSLNDGHGQFLPVGALRNFPAPEFEKYYLDTSIRWMSQFRFLRYEEYVKYYYEPAHGLGAFIDLVLEHKSSRSAILLEKLWETPPQLYYAKLTNYEKEHSVKYMKEKIALGVRRLYAPCYDRLIKKSAAHFNAYVKENGDPFSISPSNAGNSMELADETEERNTKKGYFEAYWWQ